MRHGAIAVAAIAGLLAGACAAGPPEVARDDASLSPGASPSPEVVDHSVAECDELEPVTGPPPDGPPVDGPLDDDPEVAAAQRRRAELRLDSDAETTREVLDQLAETGRDPGEPMLIEEEGQINPPREVMDALQVYQESELDEADAGRWIDRDAGGVVTVAVTEDAEAHAERIAELEAVSEHDEPVEVVDVDHSTAELDEAKQRIRELMQADREAADPDGEPVAGAVMGSGRATSLNRISVYVLDDGDGSRRAELAEVVGDPELICVNVLPPPEPPEPADGVRPLAKVAGHDVGGPVHDRNGPVNDRVDFAELAVAFDADAGAQLWDAAVPADLPHASDVTDAGRHGNPDSVDWDQQALALWRSGQSGSCPETLVDVAVADNGTVEVAIDRDTGPGLGCQEDYNPYRMVLAIDRDHLPATDALPAELEGVPRGEVTTWP